MFNSWEELKLANIDCVAQQNNDMLSLPDGLPKIQDKPKGCVSKGFG